MILTLPPHDIADVNDLSVARAEHERAGQVLARCELRMAAVIVRKVWGTTAVRLLVDMTVNDQDEADIAVLVIFDEHGAPLWVNTIARVDCYDYPGADKILNHRGNVIQDVEHSVIYNIEIHLEAAYDAVGSVSNALEVTSDEHFSSEHNLLELDVDVALMTDGSPQRRMARVMRAMQAKGEGAAKFSVPTPTDEQLWAWANEVDADLFPGNLDQRRSTYETPDEGSYDDDWVGQLRDAFDAGRNGDA